MTDINDVRIGVIGLGYVGLPLAVEFGRLFPTVGFDINADRIVELESGQDSTLEVTPEKMREATQLRYTSDVSMLASCNFYIITVPTPINEAKQPDLCPLETASHAVGTVLSSGDYVIYESTVYPGATEEICVPILEQESGLSYLSTSNHQTVTKGFHVGYSPERINPGDKKHTVTKIVKVTSGSTPEAAAYIDTVYREVITAGTYLAESIRVAEAAKVIENTQRDVNIALVNELAVLFDQLGIDTEAVLKAAGTKWNFLPFRPGLVGGHCIGVDPYYLTHKAQTVGYHPEIILAGRRINDGMGVHVAQKLVKAMIRKGIAVAGSNVLVMGLTFKENCPDLRNTRVTDIVDEMCEYGAEVDVYDPWVDIQEAEEEYKIRPISSPELGKYDAIVLAVAHSEFVKMGIDGLKAFGKNPVVLFDVKYLFPDGSVDVRL